MGFMLALDPGLALNPARHLGEFYMIDLLELTAYPVVIESQRDHGARLPRCSPLSRARLMRR